MTSSSSSSSSSVEVKSKKSKRDASPKKTKKQPEKKKAAVLPKKKKETVAKKSKTVNESNSEEKPKRAPAKRPKQLRYVKLDEKAVVPERATKGSAGYDLCSLTAESFEPGECRKIGTGLAMAIPAGYCGRIMSRSGVAGRGLQCTTGGLVDSDYRGEIWVQMTNTSNATFNVKPGEAIAQIVISKYAAVVLRNVKSLGKTKRGSGGFGSTDKKAEKSPAEKKSSSSSSSSSKGD